jgi:uncharacterized protein (DUF2235 family)
MEPFGSLSPLTRKFTRFLGMAVGYGLQNDLRDAYVFLMQKYEPGDSIYLLGFSRGAFTVRAVASLLKMYGMIRKGNESLVPYAIRMLMGIQAAKENTAKVQAYFDLASEFNRTMSCAKPRIRFVGREVDPTPTGVFARFDRLLGLAISVLLWSNDLS